MERPILQVPWPKFGRLDVLEASKPAFYKRNSWNTVSKQSEVPNVYWQSHCWSWSVHFPTIDENGEKSGHQQKSFSVRRFMRDGLSEEDAEAAALDAAKTFREELVKQGILKEPKPVDPSFTSEVPGVHWDKQRKKWQVQLRHTGKKSIWGGCFTEKAEAEAKALELAKEHGLERRVKAVGKLSELPIFKPKVPYPGVKWNRFVQQWHAQCNVNGAKRNFMVKPKDHSEAKLEASFQKAVAWKKKQEKENAKAKLRWKVLTGPIQ